MNRVFLYFLVYILGVTMAIAQVKSENIILQNGQIELPGTLTHTSEKQPLLIWVHGSGNIDRNGNQLGTPVKANYIKQFRDAVNKENIAFFSFDKRTSNKKNSAFLKNTKITDFVLDVQEVVKHFKKDKRFSKIVLIGHSQGSLIAMLASKNVDKYISIAGAGETIDKTILKQLKAKNPTLGKAAKQQFDTLKIKGKIETVNPFLISIFAKPNQPFLLSWMQLNPTKEIKKVKKPTLIIQGTKDLQVKIEDAKALNEAKPNAKLVLIENMNHVLKQITKNEDNLTSYYSNTFSISEKLIEVVVKFVKQ